MKRERPSPDEMIDYMLAGVSVRDALIDWNRKRLLNATCAERREIVGCLQLRDLDPEGTS